MHSIILIREANDFDVRVSIGKFLEAKNISFIVLKDRPEYSGFLIQQELKDDDLDSIGTHISTYSSQSCIHFNEGVPSNPGNMEPRPFDFKDYGETSISGPGMEMDIDELINRASKTIQETIACPKTRKQAISAIGDLWCAKILEWIQNKD